MHEKEIIDLIKKRIGAKLLIFTDLDATLLDDYTYSFKEAEEALTLAEEREIDIIFTTSKTRAEVDIYRKKMGNYKPFIVENGGALFSPLDYFTGNPTIEALPIIDNLRVKIFGLQYSRLVKALKDIKSCSSLKIKGINELTVEEVSRITSLPLEEARLAKTREFSIPFIIEGEITEEEESQLLNLIKSKGYALVRGARFFHLSGGNEKGKALRFLLNAYKKHYGCDFITVGIGDSKNDISLLLNCDIPVAVKRPSGNYNPKLIKQTNPFPSDGIGPVGWNKGITKIIKIYDRLNN